MKFSETYLFSVFFYWRECSLVSYRMCGGNKIPHTLFGAIVIDYDPSFAVHMKKGQVFTYKLSTMTHFVRPDQSLNCLQGQKLPLVGGKLI